VAALILSALVTVGCQNDAGATNAPAAVTPGTTQPVTHLEHADFSGMTFSLVSTRGLGRLDVTAKYTITGIGTQASLDPDARTNALNRIASMQSPEFTLLWLYVQNAVLQSVNEGVRTPGLEVTLKPDDGSVRRNGPWWIEEAEGTQYGVQTLALRQGTGDMLRVTNADPNTETDWQPFTPETYPHWWDQLDQRMGLEVLFGNR
jgi:hypothetical protein